MLLEDYLDITCSLYALKGRKAYCYWTRVYCLCAYYLSNYFSMTDKIGITTTSLEISNYNVPYRMICGAIENVRHRYVMHQYRKIRSLHV